MRSSLSKRERPARRIGELASILFLALLGIVASMTSLPAGAQDQGAAPVAITAPTAH